SGIGRAVVEALQAEGCRVAVWDASEKAKDVSGTLGCRVDITDRAAIAETLRRTEAELGPVDHLVHAAAIGSGKFGFPFTNLTPEDWPRVLEVNIMGMTNVAHALAPLMVERRRGTM